MKKYLAVFLLLLALLSTNGFSQTHFNISGQVGVPTGDFRNSTDAIGGGIRAGLFFPFAPEAPIYFGIDFGYLLYGSNTLDINQNLQVVANNVVISNIPVNLRVITNNNIINTYGVFRFKAPLANVQPYLDVMGGFNYVYTRTKILDNTANRIFTSNRDNNEISARTALQDFVFSYGGGVGMMIKFANIALDVRGAYLFGGEAEYFDSSQTNNWSVQFSGPTGTFNPVNPNPNDLSVNPDANPKKSTTNMIILNIGVTFNF